jgi:hypothetical protein
MRKNNKKTTIKQHKKAKKESHRRKDYSKKKHLWNLGIGLYETEKERD